MTTETLPSDTCLTNDVNFIIREYEGPLDWLVEEIVIYPVYQSNSVGTPIFKVSMHSGLLRGRYHPREVYEAPGSYLQARNPVPEADRDRKLQL